MKLIPSPANTVPADGELMQLVASDGMPLRAARWPARRGPVLGTVCLVQGRAEFIEKYFEVVEELRSRGFAVVAFDWRGQGQSGREVDNPRKGHVRDLADYRLDLEAVRDQVLEPLMPRPHFALAHSMGGAVCLWGAREGWLPFERLVAVAPMVALCMINRPKAVQWAARLLYFAGMSKTFVPGGGETSIATKPFAGNRLTSDPDRYARNALSAAAVGEGAVGDPTVGWLHAAFRLMDRFADPRFALELRLPTLIVAAGADPICATPATERLAARLKSGHALVLPGARHEILMERDDIRERFWAAFDAFVPGTVAARVDEEIEAA